MRLINMTGVKRYIVVALAVFLIIMGGIAAYFVFQIYRIGSAQQVSPQDAAAFRSSTTTTSQIAEAYALLYSDATFEQGNLNLLQALQTFRSVAADESQPNFTRSQALNGINYAYTRTNFDADDIYNVVFSRPPFSAYYAAPAANVIDPLHPGSGGRVEAVENAIFKLNQFSNALFPNHYAIVRMEMGEVFQSQREGARDPSTATESRIAHAKKIEDLIKAYDALPDIDTMASYSTPMRMQILFAHASALAFAGRALGNPQYGDKGEELFFKDIAIGESYPKDRTDSSYILNESLLARIFYAVHYWGRYQGEEQDKVKDVLRPLTDVAAVKGTTVYTEYLPSHKAATVSPFSTLRVIAADMPELKTFLQGLGWKF
jgi:hypothetical protein